MNIEIQQILSADSPLLEPLLAIYAEAFPPEERREASQLRLLLSADPRMALHALLVDGEPAGLLVCWRFGDFCYLEHLAVRSDLRNRRIGSHVLAWIAANLPGVRLLEAEPADTPVAARRIAYYRRHGYEVATRAYVQPSYREASDACPLWIMTSEPVGTDRLARMLATVKREAYRRPLELS
jgi:ribosomal protein S18 acetylase RimI-like enzyme